MNSLMMHITLLKDLEGFLSREKEETAASFVECIVKSMTNDSNEKEGSGMISEWFSKTKSVASAEFKEPTQNDYKSDLDKIAFLIMYVFFRGSTIKGNLSYSNSTNASNSSIQNNISFELFSARTRL